MNDDSKKEIDDIITDPEIKDRFKQLVLDRVSVMPDTLQIAVGASNLTKQELVQHVRHEDEIGKQVMELELEFLRDLASGAVYGDE